MNPEKIPLNPIYGGADNPPQYIQPTVNQPQGLAEPEQLVTNYPQSQPQPTAWQLPRKRSSKKRLLIGAGIILAILLLFFGSLAWFSRGDNKPPETTPTPNVSDLGMQSSNKTLQINVPLTVTKDTHLQNLTVAGTAEFQSSVELLQGLKVTGNTTIDGNLTVTGTINGADFPPAVNNGPAGPQGQVGDTGATGPEGPAGVAGPSGVATCPNGSCVSLQATTPGVAEAGNVNITGTLLAGFFSGDGSNLTGLNASNVASGTLADARLSGNVVLKNASNTFTALNDFTGGLQQSGNSVCDTSDNCGYAPGSGSGNYIQNQSAVDQNASFRISGSGYIGGTLSVGNTAPIINGGSVSLYVESNFTDAINVGKGTLSVTNFDPTGSALGAVGMSNLLQTAPGNTQNITILEAANNVLAHKGDGNVLIAAGNIASVFNDGTGTISGAVAGSFSIGNSASGTIQNAIGVWSSIENDGDGLIQNAYGMQVYTAGNFGSGSITNNYGLYIQDQSGVATGDNYNLYSAGANSSNYFEGKVGIGTPTPSAKLQVEAGSTSNDFTGQFQMGTILNNTVTPTTDGNWSYFGLQVHNNFDSTATLSGDVTGALLSASASNAAHINNVIANSSYAFNYSAADVNRLIGVNAYTEQNFGSVSNSMAIVAQNWVSGGSAVGDAYGLLIQGVGGGGTVTNNYGLYVDDQSTAGTASDYNIYSAGANSQNYFAGSVGIGTTSLVGAKLNVTATNMTAAYLQVNSASGFNYGIFQDGQVTASGASFIGSDVEASASGAGVNANYLYGYYANLYTLGGATASNGYGLYIDSMSPDITNRYGIYQAGAADKNYFAGNVGIGTNTPGILLDVQQTSTGLPGNSQTAGFILTVDNADTSMGNKYASRSHLSLPTTNTQNYSYLFGSESDVLHEGTGNLQNVYGLNSYVTNEGSGTITNSYGVNAFSDNYSNSAITNAYGLNAAIMNDLAGTITNAYGINIQSATNPSGTVTNNYGLYIQDQSGVGSTSSYNLYSAGASSKNYFAGNVGIGTVNPGSKLDVYNATASSNVNIFRILSDVGGTANVKFRVDSDGDIFTDGSTTIGTPADVAENYQNNDGAQPGDVVVFSGPQQVSKASQTAQKGLAGVVSSQPGLLLSGNTAGVPVALSGRVPVKVSTTNGPIQAGDYLTSAPGGKAQKATAAGPIIGTALESTDTDGIIEVFVHLGDYYPTGMDTVQSQNSSLQPQTGNFSSLNVSGPTTLTSLTVAGDAIFNGTLTVKSATFNGNLTVNGHVITGNASGNTTVAANTAVCGVGCTITISGNDTSGVITVNTGTGVAAGTFGTVTFASAYGSAPKIVLTPNTVPASSAFPQYYYASTTTTFDLKSYNALTDSKTYTFSYHVEQ